MPLFFFNIRDREETFADLEGVELQDLNAAINVALVGAREVLCERIIAGEPIDGGVIEVTDEDGTILHILRFRDAFRL